MKPNPNCKILLVLVFNDFVISNFINFYRRKVHRASVNGEIRHIHCVDVVVVVRTISKNHNVLNVDILREKCDHVIFYFIFTINSSSYISEYYS